MRKIACCRNLLTSSGKKIIPFVSILVLIITLACIPLKNREVYAEETTGGQIPAVNVTDKGEIKKEIGEGNVQINLSAVSELEGFTLAVMDSDGNKIGNTTIDALGGGEIVVPQSNRYVLSLSTEKPVSIGIAGQRDAITVFDVIKYVLLAVWVSGIVTYLVTRRRIMHRFDGAFDVIRDDELDD